MNSLDLSIILAIPIGLAIVLIILVIQTPLNGVLIRYRANFVPATGRIRLEEEFTDAYNAPVAPKNTIGYFGMMKRVFKLEGWAGLFKGFMPNLLSIICYAPLSVLFLVSFRPGIPPSFAAVGIPNVIAFLLAALIVGIPLTILTNRAIVTPYRLSYFGVRSSLRALFTPYERRRPWMLYLTPGLLMAVVSQMIIQFGFTLINQWLFTPVLEQHQVAYIIAVISLVLVVTTISVPLQIISTRLSVQRNFGGEPPSFEMDPEDIHLQEYSSEHVIQIRDKPYTGMIDCGHKMVRKEGWRTLFRAWWLTLLPNLFIR
ncbi:mitochondrial carrier domain-containing protein [Rhodocollybia butyracea]|uniref:Mitochondrial carrier domain-containing protein n=1 Tax=Rhodocollybia butyracea TaxID=206335 RepID=A0A9P5PRV9_9AGAR|nr:mitochondrial carrier domain-containing protein [Rhodocollybia butyracea]